MKYEILQWDSDLFGFKIAKVVFEDTINDNFQEVIHKLKENNVKLIYCYINPDNSFNQQLKEKYKAFQVDEKVTYTQNIENRKFIVNANIIEYKKGEITSKLISLAIQSSEYSRFRIDKHFPENSCDKLYAQWITNSVKNIFDNAVYVYLENDIIKGLVTLKDKPDAGSISIIGVDKGERGKNIGTELIHAAFFHYQQLNLNKIDVVTQKANKPACKFYEKNGFEIEYIENIYHIWL
jgi:dTDP-4-amino-4,6-dideoxy-D-galactose acyltransferase